MASLLSIALQDMSLRYSVLLIGLPGGTPPAGGPIGGALSSTCDGGRWTDHVRAPGGDAE
ncbi:MAG: hypothetical protein CME34_05760 [Gordonia sp.]|nr:hypothetical protein [Gordonia sp. (in: high G+C Gram-positive bacteria)]